MDTGLSQVIFADISPQGSEVKVLKVIVPGLESFNQRVPRVGPRLLAHIKRWS
jgi:ribosomal protein S12 methylthiotransferase accessory factor YcaO